MPVMTPDDLHRFLEEHFPQAPPGIVVEAIEDATIRIRQKTHDGHLRPGGTLSGPTMMAMVDCGFYLLLLGRLGPAAVAMAVTTNLNINFMRKPEPGDLLGEARLLKLGRALAVGDFTIWSEGKEDPVAHATVTYSIPPARRASFERYQ
ncbi:PaaI family thioesterase [Reyranella sp.]|uniref:PaaI family thioesterase n=1 Tax=Reyranella sp. TaxID=1929291 RepID=UPI003D0B8C20